MWGCISSFQVCYDKKWLNHYTSVIARSYVWWPGIDTAIENIARSCTSCSKVQATPQSAPVHPWALPERPWQCLHNDFCGPLFGHVWLVCVDTYSKWPKLASFTNMPSVSPLIEALRTIFARFGLPEQLVYDNGSQFTAAEFQDFRTFCGIR